MEEERPEELCLYNRFNIRKRSLHGQLGKVDNNERKVREL
jgi:hypothetical protein